MRGLVGSREDGATLVEVLVAISILGIAFVAIIGGMYTSIKASDLNRKQANAAIYLTSYAESAKGDPYVACASSYGSGFSAPAGFAKDPVVVAYWNAATSSFGAICGVDSGLQRVTLSIRSNDASVVSAVQIAKRR